MKHLLHLALIGAMSATLYAAETVSRISEADYLICQPQESYNENTKKVLRVFSEFEKDEYSAKFELKDKGRTFGALDYKYQRTNKKGYMVYEEQATPANSWVTIGREDTLFYLYVAKKDEYLVRYECIARKN